MEYLVLGQAISDIIKEIDPAMYVTVDNKIVNTSHSCSIYVRGGVNTGLRTLGNGKYDSNEARVQVVVAYDRNVNYGDTNRFNLIDAREFMRKLKDRLECCNNEDVQVTKTSIGTYAGHTVYQYREWIYNRELDKLEHILEYDYVDKQTDAIVHANLLKTNIIGDVEVNSSAVGDISYYSINFTTQFALSFSTEI